MPYIPNWDGKFYLDELEKKGLTWLQAIQVGHREGAKPKGGKSLLDPAYKQALGGKHFKYRHPATNQGIAVPGHWFCGDRFLNLVHSGKPVACTKHGSGDCATT